MAGGARPEVTRILYPALPGDPGHALWKRDFKGACGLFGFELKPVSDTAVAAFVDGLHHFGIGYSWGGFESLILPSHIHAHCRILRRRRARSCASMPGWRMRTI